MRGAAFYESFVIKPKDHSYTAFEIKLMLVASSSKLPSPDGVNSFTLSFLVFYLLYRPALLFFSVSLHF